MFGWNTNAIHNYLNAAIAILSALLISSGCTADSVSGSFNCSLSWINPFYITLIIGVIGAAKVLINIVRDGFFGLFKQQPPVADDVKTVVITTPAKSNEKVEIVAEAVKK